MLDCFVSDLYWVQLIIYLFVVKDVRCSKINTKDAICLIGLKPYVRSTDWQQAKLDLDPSVTIINLEKNWCEVKLTKHQV